MSGKEGKGVLREPGSEPTLGSVGQELGAGSAQGGRHCPALAVPGFYVPPVTHRLLGAPSEEPSLGACVGEGDRPHPPSRSSAAGGGGSLWTDWDQPDITRAVMGMAGEAGEEKGELLGGRSQS